MVPGLTLRGCSCEPGEGQEAAEEGRRGGRKRQRDLGLELRPWRPDPRIERGFSANLLGENQYLVGFPRLHLSTMFRNSGTKQAFQISLREQEAATTPAEGN